MAREPRGDTDGFYQAIVTALTAAIAYLLGRQHRDREEPEKKPEEKPPVEPEGNWFTRPLRKQDRKKLREEREKEAREKAVAAKSPAGASAPAAAAAEKKETDAGALSGIAIKVLGAIATGIGVAGAVTFVGAGIFWLRFDAIGLPATQAVSVMPRTELLVQGAQEMALFLLIGLGAALVIALADPKGLITGGTVVVLGALVAGGFAYTVASNLDFLHVLVLTAGTVVLALLCVWVAYSTDVRLVPLMVSVFVASLIFSASCALLIVYDEKYAQAIAIRFEAGGEGPGDKPETNGLTGIYVTATDKTLYFARSGDDPELAAETNGKEIDTTGLYEVPLGENTTYAIGPLLPTDTKGVDPIVTSAEALLERLNLDAKSFPAKPPQSGEEKPKKSKATTPSR